MDKRVLGCFGVNVSICQVVSNYHFLEHAFRVIFLFTQPWTITCKLTLNFPTDPKKVLKVSHWLNEFVNGSPAPQDAVVLPIKPYKAKDPLV